MIHLPYIRVNFCHFLSCGNVFCFKCIGDVALCGSSERALNETIDRHLSRGVRGSISFVGELFLK